MDIAFAKRRLEKIFNSERALNRQYGAHMARTIAMRMAVLANAGNLSMVPVTKPERRHQLEGKRTGQFAVDLVHPQRLVFAPDHDPVPRREDGGIDIKQVSAVRIIEVVDYH